MSDESRLKINVTVDGAFVKDVAHNILSHDTHEEYNVVSDVDGVSIIILPIGVYTITSTYTRENTIYDSQINTVTVKSPYKSYMNSIDVSLNSCHDVLLDKSCKYFHHDPFMTPNNFDFYFDYNNIPVNIITESPSELHKRLQSCLPLDKILHLNLDKSSEEYGNTINVYNKLTLNYKTRLINSYDENIFTPKIVCDWNDELILEYLLAMEEYSVLQLLKSKSEELNLPYTLPQGAITKLTSDIYYKKLNDTFSVELSNFFNNVFGILELSASEIREIGRANCDDPDSKTDGELSIIGADFIMDVRNGFVSECESIYSMSVFDFHEEIHSNFYRDNGLVANNLVLNSANNYRVVVDDGNGISYYKGVLRAIEIIYDNTGGVDANEELNVTYVNGLFNVPSEFDKITLTMYKIFEENGELKFELNNYNIDYDEYYFYTCNDCGKIIYSNNPVTTCSECESNNILVSDMPYKVYLEDYGDKYYTDNHLQII